MTNQLKWAEDLSDFMQSSFDTTVNTLSMLQDQGEKIINTLLDQGLVAQQEGRKVLNDWVEMGKKGRDEYKRMMKDNLGKLNEFFKSASPSSKTK